MAFLSFNFLLLFAVTFLLYAFSKARFRNYYLLLASCVFIGWHNIFFLILSIIISIFTFYSAQAIERNKDNERKVKSVYFLSIAFLVGIWILFHNQSCFESILGGFQLSQQQSTTWLSKILYPLGMSFYTFQAIGYLTDIYWEEDKSEKKFLDFMLYMLFFLKFLSGPIERFTPLIEQIRQPQSFKYSNATYGIKLIFLGMMKKLLIANYLSPYTSEIFSNIGNTSGLQLVMVCLIYPIELYTDFSGYTDMAIGGARMFGITLSTNFNFPFSAKSTADLWRRWHMSLSFWVRDYLFVPLTAFFRNWRTYGVYISLLITFTLLGLWHGIGYNFVFYGLIQGIIIALEMKFSFLRKNLESIIGIKWANAIYIIRTYILFALSLIFFRVTSFADALLYFSNLSFVPHRSWKEMNIGMSDHFCIVAGVSLLLMLIYEVFSVKRDLISDLGKLPLLLRWTIYFVLAFALFTFGMFDNDNFIYLQF